LDVGYIGTNYKGTGTNTKVDQSQSFLGQSAQSPSRFGIKGTEDLGGGTSVFFLVETGLNPNQATASTWNNRQSYLGLKQVGLGQIAVGTQYTGMFRAVAVTDAGQINDMIGDVISATNVQAFGNPGSGPYADAAGTSGGTGGCTTRTSNTVSFDSEQFAGVKVNGFYALNNQSQTQTNATTGGKTNYNGFGLGANYTWNKLYVTANYQALKSLISAATLTTPQPTLWTAASGGVNTQDNQKYVAATYDFGIVKGYAQWINRKAVDTLNTNYFANRTAQQVGVRGYITPVVEGWAQVGNGKVSAFGANQPTANFVGYQAGANYWLSKRTNLYAIYGQNQTSSTSTVAGVSASNYAAGVRHTF
jgi:predicted porin